MIFHDLSPVQSAFYAGQSTPAARTALIAVNLQFSSFRLRSEAFPANRVAENEELFGAFAPVTLDTTDAMPEVAASQSPTNLRSPRDAASVHLDALRGIAAVGVCLSHLRNIFFRDYPQIAHHTLLLALAYLATGLGHQWVVIFFVLSGYLVGGSVLRAHATGRWAWNSYLFNRITRLFIVLAPALMFRGLLDITGIHLFGSSRIYGDVRNRLTPAVLLGNYAFLQSIVVPTLGSNTPLWSLANEFWYYIAFPALVLVLLPRTALLRRLPYLLLLVAVLLLVGPQIALAGLVWLMGVAIHYLPRIRAEAAIVRRILIAAALIALSGTLVWCKLAQAPFSDYVLGPVVALFMYSVLECSRTPMPRLYTSVAQRISHSSYTLYLAHAPLLAFIAAFLETRFHQGRWLPSPRYATFGVVLFLVVMLYAQFVWFIFEKRTDGLRRWLKGALTPSLRTDPASPDQPQ